jgi:hypothetical protein
MFPHSAVTSDVPVPVPVPVTVASIRLLAPRNVAMNSVAGFS